MLKSFKDSLVKLVLCSKITLPPKVKEGSWTWAIHKYGIHDDTCSHANIGTLSTEDEGLLSHRCSVWGYVLYREIFIMQFMQVHFPIHNYFWFESVSVSAPFIVVHFTSISTCMSMRCVHQHAVLYYLLNTYITSINACTICIGSPSWPVVI